MDEIILLSLVMVDKQITRFPPLSRAEKLLGDLWEQQISYDCMAFLVEELLSRAYDNLQSCNARLAHQRSFFQLRLGVTLILLFIVFLLFPYLGGA